MDGDPPRLTVHPRALTSVQMLESGDITKVQIQELICSQIPEDSHFSLVKEDADLPYGPGRGKTGREIWFGALRVFLKKGAPNGLLVLKVFLDVPQSVAWIMTLCSQTCASVGLATLNQSHCSFEAYVLASGPLSVIETIPEFFTPPARILAVVLRFQAFCSTMIRECQIGISRRERRVMLRPPRLPCPPGFAPRFRSSLGRYLISDDEVDDPSLLIRRLTRDLFHSRQRLDTYTSRLPGTSTTDKTAQQLYQRTKLAFHLGAVMAIIRCLVDNPEAGSSPRDVTNWPGTFKERIWERTKELLELLTSSARWAGLGGPLDLSNLPEGRSAHGLHFKRDLESTLLAAFKGACEYYAHYCCICPHADPRISIMENIPYTMQDDMRRRQLLQIRRDILAEHLLLGDVPEVFTYGPPDSEDAGGRSEWRELARECEEYDRWAQLGFPDDEDESSEDEFASCEDTD